MLMSISDCSWLPQETWDWLQIYKSEHRRERQSHISYETGSNCLLPPTSMTNCRHLVIMLISALSTKGKHWKGWKEGPEVSQQPSPLSFSLSSVPRQPLTSWLRSLLHSFCWVFRFNRRLLSWACTSVSSNYFLFFQSPGSPGVFLEIRGWMNKSKATSDHFSYPESQRQ